MRPPKFSSRASDFLQRRSSMGAFGRAASCLRTFIQVVQAQVQFIVSCFSEAPAFTNSLGHVDHWLSGLSSKAPRHGGRGAEMPLSVLWTPPNSQCLALHPERPRPHSHWCHDDDLDQDFSFCHPRVAPESPLTDVRYQPRTT